MSYEWLKYISPLLGVGLGVFIAPYVDARRSKKESKHAMNCFYSELDDYLEDTPKYVQGFHDCYMKSKKTELGIIQKDEQLFPLHFYPKIHFLTIDNLIEKSFLDLTKDQRKAVKALKILAEYINEKTAIISKYKTVDEFKKSKSESESAAATCASWYYLLSRLTFEKERFIYFDLSAEETSQKGMDALKLSFNESVFGDAHNK